MSQAYRLSSVLLEIKHCLSQSSVIELQVAPSYRRNQKQTAYALSTHSRTLPRPFFAPAHGMLAVQRMHLQLCRKHTPSSSGLSMHPERTLMLSTGRTLPGPSCRPDKCRQKTARQLFPTLHTYGPRKPTTVTTKPNPAQITGAASDNPTDSGPMLQNPEEHPCALAKPISCPARWHLAPAPAHQRRCYGQPQWPR
jgi:hypothetical protein